MTREEKENLLREAVDILIKLDNHLMTSRDNAEFSQWVEDLIDGCGYIDERDLVNMEWEEEPFINKPCISTGVCHEDKVKVLDKIRAEIEQVKSIMNEEIINHDRKDLINFVNGLNQSLVIINKYKAESEVRNDSNKRNDNEQR